MVAERAGGESSCPNGSSDNLGFRGSRSRNGRAGLVWAPTVCLRDIRFGTAEASCKEEPLSVASLECGSAFGTGESMESSSSMSPPLSGVEAEDILRTTDGSSSPRSMLLISCPNSSTRPCSMATGPMISVSCGIPGTPAKTIPMPTMEGDAWGLTFLREGPMLVGGQRDE